MLLFNLVSTDSSNELHLVIVLVCNNVQTTHVQPLALNQVGKKLGKITSAQRKEQSDSACLAMVGPIPAHRARPPVKQGLPGRFPWSRSCCLPFWGQATKQGREGHQYLAIRGEDTSFCYY